MKLRLRRINRGIVLGLAAIIVFAGYISYSSSRFKNHERDIIEQTVKSYASEILQCSVSSSTDANDSASAKMREDAAREVVEKYWMQSDFIDDYNKSPTTPNYYSTKKDYLSGISGYSENPPSGYISSASCDVVVTKIKKNGASGATVSVKVTYQLCGTQTPFFFGMAELTNFWQELSPDKLWEYSYEGNLQMYKDDGEWKIVGADYFYSQMY